MRSPATVSSCLHPVFLVGVACAIAAVAVVCASGCMTDTSRNAFQSAMSDVNSGLAKGKSHADPNDRNVYGNYVP